MFGRLLLPLDRLAADADVVALLVMHGDVILGLVDVLQASA